VNDEFQMTIDEWLAERLPSRPVRHSSFVIRHS